MTKSSSRPRKVVSKDVKTPSEPTGLRALIVDDESIMLVIGSNMLRYLGFMVDSAGGSTEALNCLKNYKYDLVLTDLVMSEMDGVELARRIRALSKKTKIVIMTGAKLDHVQEKMTTKVADHWLFKPFGYSQLEEVVHHFFPGDGGSQ